VVYPEDMFWCFLRTYIGQAHLHFLSGEPDRWVRNFACQVTWGVWKVGSKAALFVCINQRKTKARHDIIATDFSCVRHVFWKL